MIRLKLYSAVAVFTTLLSSSAVLPANAADNEGIRLLEAARSALAIVERLQEWPCAFANLSMDQSCVEPDLPRMVAPPLQCIVSHLLGRDVPGAIRCNDACIDFNEGKWAGKPIDPKGTEIRIWAAGKGKSPGLVGTYGPGYLIISYGC
jgi:hypothetical protein